MGEDLTPREPFYVVVPLSGPSIESDRLLLRPVEDNDAAALFAVRGRPEVAKTKYIKIRHDSFTKFQLTLPNSHPKEPFQSIEQTKKWMASKIFTSPAMVMNCSFFYAIVDKSITDTERQVIGYMSINSVDPSPEIGYSILPESWGKGFATEALQMLLKMWWDLPRMEIDDMDRASGFVEKIYALCETCNPASGSVLRKCGFEVVKTMRFGTDELYLWSLKKSDFTHEEANKKYRYVKN
ncbi:Acyl-CoA N-acyltransferase [Penicillium verhagenii]|uniref:Acyl-CoA N-acyltransferase n=1 Tax=Penicillium verhagenii TaxID=1562060 RepID=UPI0025459935|nr:Acyl-CoA N-acyltransferase [Penicillium verhagenii]KAJ5947459.1 Acyl-CoA N-acyltransferase [Penicillium verhagenii]